MSTTSIGILIPKLVFKRSATALKKAFQDARKPVLAAIGKLWHDKFLPLHFQTIAYSRYGYKDRTREYEIRKARKKGHRRPLVWSGNVEKATRSYTMTTTSKRVSVRMTYPNVTMRRDGKEIAVPYLSLKGQDKMGIDKKAELLTIAPVEMEIFQDKAADMLTLAMQTAQGNPVENMSVADVA